MVIGFVGLGIMGKPMAKNLCRAGYTLIVNDHHKENVDELVQAGARSGDLKQIGMESDVVITMLPNSPQVKDWGKWYCGLYEKRNMFYRYEFN